MAATAAALSLFLIAAPAAADDAETGPSPAAAAQSLESGVDELIAQVDPPAEPDIFGFGALRLGESNYDDIWREAAAQPWPDGRPELDAFVASLRDLPVRERAQAANAWVNARVRYGVDLTHIDHHWESLGAALARGRGDRDEIAVAKMKVLAAAGVPSEDLYLVLANDVQRLQPDALLVVRDGESIYVLGSKQDAFIDEQRQGLYVPVVALGYHGEWIFGHRIAHAGAAPPALDVGQASYQSLQPRAR